MSPDETHLTHLSDALTSRGACLHLCRHGANSHIDVRLRGGFVARLFLDRPRQVREYHVVGNLVDADGEQWEHAGTLEEPALAHALRIIASLRAAGMEPVCSDRNRAVLPVAGALPA